MPVPAFLNTIEQTDLSVWIRESESVFGYYFVLVFHTIGLSVLVGTSVVVSLRLLGATPPLPLTSLGRLYRLIWLGLGVNVASGLLLLYAYPTKAFTNPVFYLKLTLLGLAVWMMIGVKRRAIDATGDVEPAVLARARTLAMWSLVLWAAVISTGRLLAYTSSYILYGKIM
jgi:hypothetical protein